MHKLGAKDGAVPNEVGEGVIQVELFSNSLPAYAFFGDFAIMRVAGRTIW